MRPFRPLVRNPHLLTVAASLWPRSLDEDRYPVQATLFRPEPDVHVLVHSQQPEKPRGEALLVHGLEGSSDASYMRGMAQALLEAGCAVHRFNIRTCGGTEMLCRSLYHAGLTSDLFALLMEMDRRRRTPVFLIGFSLGGNTVLKLAGELGGDAWRLLAGVCAISTPIDLELCARRLAEPANWLYERYFLRSLKRRLRARRPILDNRLPFDKLDRVSTIYEFDDWFTAVSFGFAGAAGYYATQSASNFLSQIRVPTLIVQAKDDPMIPFASYAHPAFTSNPNLRLVAVDHGGHIGFLARNRPRIWVDAVVSDWVSELRRQFAA